MSHKKSFLYISALGIILTANAQALPQYETGLPQNSISSVISAYRFYKDINNVSINAPTTIEIPFAEKFIERLDFAVFDKTANSFEPYFFKQKTLTNEIPVTITSNPNICRFSSAGKYTRTRSNYNIKFQSDYFIGAHRLA